MAKKQPPAPEPKRGRGRPTKFDQRIAGVIVAALESGQFIDTACTIAGIDKGTYRNWLKRGEDAYNSGEANEWSEFFTAVKSASAQAEESAVKGILRAGKTQWQALAWFLERRFASKWAKSSEKPGLTSTPTSAQPLIVTEKPKPMPEPSSTGDSPSQLPN